LFISPQTIQKITITSKKSAKASFFSIFGKIEKVKRRQILTGLKDFENFY
jgi:hypothetical protein